MATELPPGFDAEVQEKLKEFLGADWENSFTRSLGSDWVERCTAQLERNLGMDWQYQPAEVRAETLYSLVSGQPGTAAEAPASHDPAYVSAAPEQEREPEPTVPSEAETPWLNTLAEVNTFEEWLARIGIDTTLLPPRA